jgi:hypothetical protein
MADLDLDIGNYTIKDLEAFFKFKSNAKYTASDIELRETTIREQLLQSGHVDKRMKRDLISFLSSAKEWLMAARCSDEKKPPSALPAITQLDRTNYPRAPTLSEPRTDDIIHRKETPYINTFNQEYYTGWMNPLVTKTITKCLTVDTRFRENYYNTSSSDFIIQLPTKITKAVSMQLASFEFPVSFYGVSEAYGNNYFYLEITWTDANDWLETGEPGGEYVTGEYLMLSDGNYNAQDFISLINGVLSPTDENGDLVYPTSILSYVQFYFDLTDTGSGTGKTYITTTGQYANLISNIRIDFALDFDGNTFQGDLSTRIGWNLGFQKRAYDGDILHVSETVIEPVTIRYLYLAIDDFHNSVNNHFVTAFKDHILSPNILARIALKGSYFSLIMENNIHIVSEPRKYFGPVDIQRFRIRVYDDRGRILNMNHSDFSFCLNFKLLYDV